jgi:hypothetical protein
VLAERPWQFLPLLLCKAARSALSFVFCQAHCYPHHVFLLLLQPLPVLVPWGSRQACCALLLLLLWGVPCCCLRL